MNTAFLRLGQVLVTFVLFAACNLVALHFQVEEGVSILFPAAAVSIVACMSFGIWAAIGVVLGTIVTPYSPSDTYTTLVMSGVICAVEGLIPYWVFTLRKDLTRDLRDMKSLVAFLLFGTILNSTVSAIAGALLVLPQFTWRGAFVWWISDFVAAVLLALPLLAFGGALFSRLFTGHRPEQPRTISNALQIVTVIILLGFGASFAIRSYLITHFEESRLTRQRTVTAAQERLSRIHSNFLRAVFADPNDLGARTAMVSARRTNDDLLSELAPLVQRATPQLVREYELVADGTRRWFAQPSNQTAVQQTARAVLALRSGIDHAHSVAEIDFTRTRRKILLVSAIVDAMVFLVLVLASATMLYTISRPFAQVRAAIERMRQGQPVDPSRVDAHYVEFQSIATTLEEAARELRQREEELRLQTEKAIRASKHKSDFLAKMSHELRTPLNSIIGFSDLLIEQEETITTEKRLGFLDNVAGSAKHLLKLINDLLDIAKVESGKMKMQFENVDLRLAISNTVASTQSLFVRKRQQVEVSLPPEPMMARADLGRLEQVLLNLLSNANKFSAEGDTVTVRSAGDDEMWHIEVADRGIGIRSEDQKRIFDEFEQVHERGVHSTGTGLGLALARRFVEAHGGDIAVESELGGGAVFRVRLPRLTPVGIR